MNTKAPPVSIGLPVYNGEKFIEEELNSLLAQTFSDFELIISDNASTDRTGQICQAYAAKDKRIRYYRNEQNIGANPNFNRAFELSSGEYFKWAAADDVHRETFIERCIEVLNRDPSVVLAHPRIEQIDENGRLLGPLDFDLDVATPRPHERFYNMIHVDHWCYQIFGLYRSTTLRKMPGLANYYGADRVWLAEVSLRGKIYELPDYLFLRRNHSGDSWKVVRSGTQNNLAWFYGAKSAPRKLSFVGFKRFRGYFSAVNRVPIGPSERILCYLQLIRLMVEKSANRIKKRLNIEYAAASVK
jgi:glycosyltransferase involved in cell wall biosynthesis